jgi:Na+/H+ antiporter NhaC
LVPFIGWGVYIMSLIYVEYEALGISESEFTAFVRAIPFQFYAWLAVMMVPLLTFLRFDFGAMAKAEKVAEQDPDEDSKALAQDKSQVQYQAFTHPNAKPVLVWAPLIVLAVVLGIMLVPLGFPFEQISGTDFRAGLSTAYLTAATLLIALMAALKVREVLGSIEVFLNGMTGMTLVAVTLLLAWALSDIGRLLGAADYIAAVAQAGLPYWMLPAVAFVLAAIISFATGSSWGTFAIMFPLIIPTALAIDAPLHVCIGAVLSGGLFGDHSSPISETTILSSTGASCPQIEHFRTQLPYALFNGVISLSAFVVAGVTGSALIILVALAAQIAGLLVIRRLQSSS